MELRDTLNTKEGYEEIIGQRLRFSEKTQQKIISLNEDEKQGIQKHPKTNSEIIESSYWRLFEDFLTLFKTKYSTGEAIGQLEGDYRTALSCFIKSWKPQARYLQMLDMICLGILLEIEDEEFSKLTDLLQKHNVEDKIFDYFIGTKKPDRPLSEGILWPKLHTSGMVEIIETEDQSRAIELLTKYLNTWYKNVETKTHESKWNIHTGYWCWEAGALVKTLGLDDSSLKDQQYYPYDMVHWKE